MTLPPVQPLIPSVDALGSGRSPPRDGGGGGGGGLAEEAGDRHVGWATDLTWVKRTGSSLTVRSERAAQVDPSAAPEGRFAHGTLYRMEFTVTTPSDGIANTVCTETEMETNITVLL